MFGVYMTYWYSAGFLLACIALASSLRASRRRYWLALSAYAVLVAGSAAMAVFPMFFNIGLANAFGPRSVSSAAYILPLLTLLFFAAPAIALFPFVSLARAKWIGGVFFGLALAATVVSTVYSLATKPGHYFAPAAGYGQLGLLFLLLWLRVYELRVATSKA